MDLNCNCFGVASAARVPVKRYNLLVPDVFPVTEPAFDRPLGIAIERKIKKLGEYLDKNEHRAPKVSRRLQRRLHKELSAGWFGYVKLAAHTYSALLLSKPEKSGLLANELVVRTVVKRRRLLLVGRQYFLSFKEAHLGCVVGLLLTHASPQLRKLGVDLLIDFIKCQQTSDYVPQLEAFVPLLCANASPHVTVTAVGGAAAGSPAAAAAAEAGEHWGALRAACLRALLEHLRFCARLSYVSYHLHTITFSVLESVEASGQGAPQGVYLSPRAALQQGGGKSAADLQALAASFSRVSISRAVAASPPDVAALLVFEELAHMTRDAAEGKKVLEFVVRFLDAHGRWLGGPVVETCMAVLQQACEEEHQRYLLFSTLLRHVAGAEQLTPAERAAVLELAVEESGQLERGLAAPALLLALRELPAVIASAGGAGVEVPPMPPPATAQLAAVPAKQAVNGVPASQQELELPRLPRVAAVSRAQAAGPVDLQPQVLAAVQQLAGRVEDSSQLVEAISSTVTRLRAAAPVSTAALQCCVAAGHAIHLLPPRAPRGSATAPRTFPSLLLQELASIMAHWEPQQRLLAHQLLLQLLPAAADGLKEQQAAMLLSGVWHEAAFRGNQPAAYVAMDRTLAAAVGAAPAASLPQAVKLVAALQLEVLQAGSSSSSSSAAVATAGSSGSRLAALTAAQGCALLCQCMSALQSLAAQLGQPELQQLAVPGCDSVLWHLEVAPQQGLLLRGLAPGANGKAAPTAAQQLEQGQQLQQFWLAPAATLVFSAEEEQLAAAFLASWRQATTVEQQRAQLAAALAAVPLFKQQAGAAAAGAAAGAAEFQPMPLSALMPRMMQGGAGDAYANGSVTSGEAEGESKRAQRLRRVYQHMRQVSLLDSDRAMLATISQESAAEETPLQLLRGLQLPGLDAADGEAAAAGPRSVDDVLADVDAALQAAEEAMERGRSPSTPGWAATAAAGGSSSSGGGSPVAAAASVSQEGGGRSTPGASNLLISA